MLDQFWIALISPLGTALVLWLGSLLVCGQKRWWLARFLGVLGFVWLWVWSLPVASHALRGVLESAYPPCSAADTSAAQAIVVLGGGVRPPEALGQVPDLEAAADRLWHAALLYHAAKAPLLVISGGSEASTSAISEAAAMHQLAQVLGVPSGAMLLEERSRNTRQNAQFTAEILESKGVSRILLVTSALHMRRAVSLFELQGLTVIPAATDHEARSHFTAIDWLPDANALDGSARAMKEIVGHLSGR